MNSSWHPIWWDESHTSAWGRVKEAVRRDWEQTRHDLHLPGGHELNQHLADTVKQAAGREAIPRDDRPNPPRVIGTWDEAEVPLGYGYGARQRYGAEYPVWNEGIEQRLRSEWESNKLGVPPRWSDVRTWVRHGYEYDPRRVGAERPPASPTAHPPIK